MDIAVHTSVCYAPKPLSIFVLVVFFFGRNQSSLWAAGREYRRGMSEAGGKPKLDGSLVNVVNSLSLDDNQNCEAATVAVDDNDNMVCILDIMNNHLISRLLV